MDDRYVAKRVIYLLGMSAATILFTTAAAFIRGQYLDEWIVLVIINLVFLALWFFLLEHCRMKRSIAGNRETSYRRIFAGYLASLGVTAVCLVLPEFSRPVMLSAILMLGVGNIELSLCSGLFFCSLLGLLCGGTIQEFSMYILLVLIGAVAADAVENSKKQFWYEWFAGMAGMLLPVLFYYLTYREISVRIMVSAVADGVVVFLFLHLCYRKLADARNAEVDEVMVDITDESYPLARELASFSRLQPCKAGNACGGAMCCCGRGRRTCVQRRGDVLPYRRTGGRTACKKRCENGTESLLPGEGNPHYRGIQRGRGPAIHHRVGDCTYGGRAVEKTGGSG